MSAKELSWAAFADDPLQIAMRVKGLDISAATFGYLVQANPFSDPLITLAVTETPGADGVRVVGTGETDGIPYTDIEILAAQATLATAISGFAGQGKITLYHKFQWTIAMGEGFSSLDRTIFYGPLTIFGGSNG